MNRFTVIAVSLLGATVLSATAAPPRLEVKNKSSFSANGSPRDPFWPIGWKPAAAVAAGDPADSELPASAFVVSSITIQPQGRFAIINGKIIQEGQEFGLKLGGNVFHLSVGMIQDGKVILEQHGRQIVVPLTRK
jgi:hypothetical protein